MHQKLKKQVLSFLVRTRSLKQYDELSPHQVAYKAVDLIERVIEGDNPPLFNLTNEIQKSCTEEA